MLLSIQYSGQQEVCVMIHIPTVQVQPIIVKLMFYNFTDEGYSIIMVMFSLLSELLLSKSTARQVRQMRSNKVSQGPNIQSIWKTSHHYTFIY